MHKVAACVCNDDNKDHMHAVRRDSPQQHHHVQRILHGGRRVALAARARCCPCRGIRKPRQPIQRRLQGVTHSSLHAAVPCPRRSYQRVCGHGALPVHGARGEGEVVCQWRGGHTTTPACCCLEGTTATATCRYTG